MNNLLTNWKVGEKDMLYIDGAKGTQFIVLGAILIAISLILVIMFAAYFARFKKAESSAKIMNTGKVATTFVLPVVSSIIGIFLILFAAIPGKIFGQDATDAIFGAYLGMSIPGYILAFLTIVLMWIWIPQYGISFDKEKINFVGDMIPYSKIVNFVKDEETGKVYINYTNNKNHLKRQAYPLGSVFGQFILANAELAQKEVTELNEKEFIAEFESTENFIEKAERQAQKADAQVVEEVVVEKATVKTAPQKSKPAATTAKAKAKAPAKSKPAGTTSKTTKPKATGSKSTSSIAKIGRKVPEPRPIVYVAPVEISISAHKVPKYTDKKN